MFPISKDLSTQNLRRWAKTFFVISVWYAVLVDVPVAMENLLSLNDSFFIPDRLKSSYWYGSLEPLYKFLYQLNLSYEVPWHKLGKDLFLLISILCSLNLVTRANRIVTEIKSRSAIWISYLNLLFIIIFLSITSFFRNDFWITLAGLRTQLPLLAFFVGVNVNNEELLKIWKWLRPIIFFQFAFAISQRWMHIQKQVISFHQRSAGTFFEINTFGFFLVLALVIVISVESSRIVKWGYVSFILIMIPLTRSRGIVLLAMLVLAVYAYSQLRSTIWRRLALISLMLLVPFTPLVVQWFTGRPNVLQDFLGVRGMFPVTFLLLSSPLESFLGNGFGYGTLVSYTLEPFTGIPPESSYDTLVGSLFVQGGVLLFLFTMAFILSPLRRSNYNYLDLVLPVFSIAASMIITFWEVWPANIMLMLIYGYVAGSCQSKSG